MSESCKIIKKNIQQHVEDFWSWALKSNSKEQILNGEIDSPSFPNWDEVEDNLEEAFLKHCEIARQDERKYLRDFVVNLEEAYLTQNN